MAEVLLGLGETCEGVGSDRVGQHHFGVGAYMHLLHLDSGTKKRGLQQRGFLLRERFKVTELS